MPNDSATFREALEKIAAAWGFEPESFVSRVLKLSRRKADHAVVGVEALSDDEARDLGVKTPAVEVIMRNSAFVLFADTYLNGAGRKGRQVCLTTRRRAADLQPHSRSTDSGSFYLDDIEPPEEDDHRAALIERADDELEADDAPDKRRRAARPSLFD